MTLIEAECRCSIIHAYALWMMWERLMQRTMEPVNMLGYALAIGLEPIAGVPWEDILEQNHP